MNTGYSSRTKDDKCCKGLRENTSSLPGTYRLEPLHAENPHKWVNHHVVNGKKAEIIHKQDSRIVDAESELKNLTRHLSNCPEEKFHPDCAGLEHCMTTNSMDHVNPDPTLHNIVHSNTKKQSEPHFNPRGHSVADLHGHDETYGSAHF